MGERKVLNKYYPPDFDPSKLLRVKRPKSAQGTVQEKVRAMMPMTVQCLTCGEFIPAGKKFNVRKETVVGEEYLEFTIKTNPKDFDYTCESGVTRNFDAYKNNTRELVENRDKEAEKQKHLESIDTMERMEETAKASRREMDQHELLSDLQALNAAANNVDMDAVWARHAEKWRKHELDLKAQEDAEVAAVRFRSSASHVRRLADRDDGDAPTGPALAYSDDEGDGHDGQSDDDGSEGDDDEDALATTMNEMRLQVEQQQEEQRKRELAKAAIQVRVRIIPKAAAVSAPAAPVTAPPAAKPLGMASLLGAYGDSDEE